MIKVNGKEEPINGDVTILLFLERKGINPATVIVEHNYELPDRDKWENILLKENDNLEVLKFMGGG